MYPPSQELIPYLPVKSYQYAAVERPDFIYQKVRIVIDQITVVPIITVSTLLGFSYQHVWANDIYLGHRISSGLKQLSQLV